MMKKGQLSFFLMALFFFMNMPPHIGLAETNASIEVEGIIGNQPVDVTDKNDAGKSPIVQYLLFVQVMLSFKGKTEEGEGNHNFRLIG